MKALGAMAKANASSLIALRKKSKPEKSKNKLSWKRKAVQKLVNK